MSRLERRVASARDGRPRDWSEEVRLRLYVWFRWHSGEVMRVGGSMNPIAALMKRAAGELAGDDISIPKGLTFELEVTEKTIARMRLSDMPRVRNAYELLHDVYVKGMLFYQIADKYRISDKLLRAEIWRAESICGRYMIEVERELQEREEKRECSQS